jgi:hypothetical protein
VEKLFIKHLKSVQNLPKSKIEDKEGASEMSKIDISKMKINLKLALNRFVVFFFCSRFYFEDPCLFLVCLWCVVLLVPVGVFEMSKENFLNLFRF